MCVCLSIQGEEYTDEAGQLHERAQTPRLPGRATRRRREQTDGDGEDRPHHRHRADIDLTIDIEQT